MRYVKSQWEIVGTLGRLRSFTKMDLNIREMNISILIANRKLNLLREKRSKMKVHKRKRCFGCKKIRKCIKAQQTWFCLDCFNEEYYNENCEVCRRMGKHCKRHKVNDLEEIGI